LKIRFLIEKFLVSLARNRQFDNLWLGVVGGSNDENLLDRVKEALNLIKQYDFIIYERLLRDIERILVTSLFEANGSFNFRLKMCNLDFQFVSASSPDAIASTIVHEATHARLFARGFGYPEELRYRIERICMRQQLRFARRLPEGNKISEEVERGLATAPSFWSDPAIKKRRLDGGLDALRSLGVPDRLIRFFLVIRTMRERRLHRKVAGQGTPAAQFNIGSLYQNGLGVEQDYAEAMRWFRKAADQGYREAQYSIGILYRYGQGVAQDYAKAMRWYRKAADQGYANAQAGVGVLYQSGLGVARDFAEAMRWYRKAADQGYPIAQHNLGLLYESGLGVARDIDEAQKWMQKAVDGGHQGAKDWLASH